MARNDNVSKAHIVLTMNGAQAEKVLDALRHQAENLTTQMEEMKSAGKGDTTEYQVMEKELKAIERAVRENVKEYINLDDIIKNLAGNSRGILVSALKSAAREMNNLTGNDTDKLDKLKSQYEQIVAQIRKLEVGYVNVEKVMQNLDSVSEKTLRKALTQLRDIQSSTERGSQTWEKQRVNIEALEKALDRIGKKDPFATMNNLSGSSTNDIKAAIVDMEKMRDSVILGGQEWTNYNDKINQAKEYLTQFSELQQKMSVDTAKSLVSEDTATVGQLKEAASVLREFRDSLQVTDTSGLQEVDTQLQHITERLNNVQRETLDVAAILSDPKSFSPEQIRKAITELNNQLNQMTMRDPRREGIRQQIQALNGALDETERQTVDVQQVLNNLKTASLNDLKQAAKQLEEEIGKVTRNTDAYVKKSAEYQKIKRQLDEVNKSWKQQDSTVASVMKRLAAYVGIYGVFNMIKNKVAGAVKDNLALSDSLADISKTTGMTTNQVAELSKAIDGIDTRTMQQELHDLAFQAGKLGITGTENVLQFVRAGNQLVVALGEDLGGAEAVKNLMKISDVLGLTAKMGVERALLATGSAINEVGQSSTASEGYMVDFAKRLGGIAAQSKLTMAELIGLGGTTDALGQNVEVSATALNKFLVTLQTSTRGVAQASGVTESTLKELLESGKTMEAVMMVFDGLSRRGGLAELAPLMGDLGSDGARLTAVLSSLISNTELLKAQLYTSNQAFDEAISVTNEYNIKNENAAAILARMGNAIRENFVNSGLVSWLTQVLTAISNLPRWLERNETMIKLLISALAGVTFQLTLGRLEWIKYVSTMNKVSWLRIVAGIQGVWRALLTKTTYINLATKAWKALNVAMKSNIFGLILSLITSAVAAFLLFKDRLKDTAEAATELNSKLAKEKLELDAVFGALEKANVETGERASLIQKINDKYGQYLGFMLSEKDSAEKVAAAHELINAKLRERIALDMQEAMRQSAINKYADKAADAMSNLYTIFSGQRGIGETFASDALASVQKITGENIDKSVGEINRAIQEGLGEQFKNWYSHQQWIEISGEVQKFIDTQKKVQAEVSASASVGKSIVESSAKEMEKATGNLLNSLTAEMDGYLKEITSADEARAEEVKKLAMNTAKQYLEYADKFIKENPTSKYVEWLKEPMDAYNKWIEENTPKKVSPWGGENFTIETASVDALVKRYKTLFDWRKEIALDKDYSQFKEGGFQSREEEMAALMTQLDELKAKLNDMGYNEFGKFLKTGTGERKELKAARDEHNAVMSAIEVFYAQQEQAVNESYQKRNITLEQAERKLDAIEIEHMKTRTEARKKLRGKDNMWDETLASLSDSDIAKTESSMEAIENLMSKKLDVIGQKLRKFGEGEMDGIWKKQEEDFLKMQKIAIDRQAEIDKILLSHDYTGQVTRQYQTQLEKLAIFFLDYQNMTEKGYSDAQKMAETGMKKLSDLSPDLYDIDINTTEGVDQFINMVSGIEELSSQMLEMTDDEYRTLYYKTLEYGDAITEAEKKAKDRSLKIAKERYERTQQYKDNELQGAKDKDTLDVYKAYGDIGLATPSMIQDQETLMYINRLEAAKDFYNYLESQGRPTEEAMIAVQEAASELSAKLVESTKERLSRLKEYGDAMEEFGSAFGESVFVRGEEGLEDRKKAMEDFVRSVGEATKNMILDWVKQQIEHQIIRTAMARREEEFQDEMTETDQKGGKNQTKNIQKAGRDVLKETVKWGKSKLKAKKGEKDEEEQVEKESQDIQGTIATEGTAAVTEAMIGIGQQAVMAKKTQAAENVSTSAAEAGANTSLGIASGAAQTIGQLGWWGIPLVAVITALLNGLLSAAMGKVGSLFGGGGSGADLTKTKLVTGMLTYDSGNVQALGNDGHVYNATPLDHLSTGLISSPVVTTVNGQPALVGERGPEMVIGRETTAAMMMSRPDLMKAIVQFDKNRSGRAYRTYDAGNLQQFSGNIDGEEGNEEELTLIKDAIAESLNTKMSPLLQEISDVLQKTADATAGLTESLKGGIVAKINKNGRGGLVDEVLSGIYDAKKSGNEKVKRILGR